MRQRQRTSPETLEKKTLLEKLPPLKEEGGEAEGGVLARLRLGAPLVTFGGDRFVLRGAKVDGPAGAIALLRSALPWWLAQGIWLPALAGAATRSSVSPAPAPSARSNIQTPSTESTCTVSDASASWTKTRRFASRCLGRA